MHKSDSTSALYKISKLVLRGLTRLLYGVRVEGLENVPPDGPLVVAANHRSYLDPPLLGAWFPRTIHYMAKRQLFSIPVLGPVMRWVHAFPISRDQGDFASIRRALQILKSGGTIGIFPEGTRNLAGDAEVKRGAVLLATSARCPLIPVALIGTDQAMRLFSRNRMRVRIGAPVRFEGTQARATKADIVRWTDDVIAAIKRLM